jgi:hypothetical protein
VSQARIVVIVVRIDLVLFHMGRNIRIAVLQRLVCIDEVCVGSLVLLALLDPSEVPYYGLLVSLQLLEVYSDVVVA